MSKKRILIVEDRPDDASGIGRELEKFDMQCSYARTLEEAFDATGKRDFDLILLDANLPDSDWRETIAATPRFGTTPIVIVTGDEDPELVEAVNIARLGLEFKPINIASLVPTMLKRMNQRTPSAENSQAVIAAHQQIQQAVREVAPTPWILRLAPVLALCISALGISVTGGAFLYKSIGEKATQTQENLAHFLAVDSALKIHEGELKAVHVSISNLDSMAQTSVQDRVQIHRDIETTTRAGEKANAELKHDIIDRLNRIEDKLDRVK